MPSHDPAPLDPADGASDADVASHELVALYTELGDRIASRTTTTDALAAVTSVAVESVPGVQHASITRERAERFQTLAPTDAVAAGADRLQYELGSGPCVDSVRVDGPLLVEDLAADGRWPEYGPRASAEFGIASMLSIRMVLDDEIHAGLNLYSDQVHGFSARSQTIAMVLATHGALAVSRVIARERAVNLEKALVNSRRIGMAIGVLMMARKLTDDGAFALMRIVSQNSNRRMVLVAEEIIETGTLEVPDGPGA